jgi:hypothetical protein
MSLDFENRSISPKEIVQLSDGRIVWIHVPNIDAALVIAVSSTLRPFNVPDAMIVAKRLSCQRHYSYDMSLH